MLEQLVKSVVDGISPLEEDQQFEITDFSQFFLDNLNATQISLSLYIPLINETFEILNKFGDSSFFSSEINMALSLLIEGKIDDAKLLINKYIKFTLLDDDVGY